jgi:hypothetical protein
MRKYLIVISLIIELFTLANCKKKEEVASVQSDSKIETTITGLSGNKYSLALPKGWKMVDGFESINPDNDFLYESPDGFRLIAVISELKTDFVDFDTYVDLVSKDIESSDQKPIFKDLENFKGKETEYTAIIRGRNFKYIEYIIETDKNFMQLYSWSYVSNFDEAKSELVSIMDSFHVVDE